MHSSPITIEALLVLDAIDSRGSFAAAAEQLNKVPSALSYVVQKLEQQLSVTLFVRQGRRSVLTPAGRHLLVEGRKVLAAMSKITEQTQTISHGWEPKIRIAFDSIIDIECLLEPLALFLNEHPNVEVDLCEEVMNGGWEALTDGRVDLLIGASAPIPNQQGIRSSKFIRLSNVFVVPMGHELASAAQPINKNDIKDYRTVVVHDSAQHEVPWSSNVIEQSRHFFVDSVAHKIQAIVAGIGVGFLPLKRIEPYINAGKLVEVDMADGRQSIDTVIAWKTVNQGKGLQRLRQIIMHCQSSDWG
ncbi:MAG: LysR family transcriptional regulator [Gammaproteobacteria bacterium]|nr:LysR family transcriptional regulator [Gammaproteobacteria bacterium]